MKLLATVATTLLLASATASFASTVAVFNDTFDNENLSDPSFDPNETLLKWTSSAPRVSCGSPSALTCVEIGTGTGITSTNISFEAGAVYNFAVLFASSSGSINIAVTFYLDSMIHSAETKTIETLLPTTFNSLSGSFSVTGPVAGYFEIKGLYEEDEPDLAYLDSVTVTKTTPDEPSPVPVPASAPLLLAGLGAVAALRRKTRR